MRAGPFGVGCVPATEDVKFSVTRTAFRASLVSLAAALYALTRRTVTLSLPAPVVFAVVSDQLSPTLSPARVQGKKSLRRPCIWVAADVFLEGLSAVGLPDL